MGSLAHEKPAKTDRISGILVKRNFSYHIVAPTDLASTLCITNYSHPVMDSKL